MTTSECFKPTDSQFQSQQVDLTSALKPEDFDRLFKATTQNSGNAEQTLTAKGTLPGLELVADDRHAPNNLDDRMYLYRKHGSRQ